MAQNTQNRSSFAILFAACLTFALGGCSKPNPQGDTGTTETGTVTSPTGPDTSTTSTGIGTGSGTGTGTGSGTGSGTGTGTGTGSTPGITLTGCDTTYCTLTVGGGAWGGDLCSCTFPGSMHPTGSSAEGSCFRGAAFGPGYDLTIDMDLTTMGYAGYAVDTCVGANLADSSLAVFDDDPSAGGFQEECNEDAAGQASACARITEPADSADSPWPTDSPNTGHAWIVIDEFRPGRYWNGTADRQVDIELFTRVPVCGNGTPEFHEECDDGNTNTGDGCDALCQREPTCGDGFIDGTEECDDSNTTDGDGCSSTCQNEPFVVDNCDSTYCTLTSGAGPNGGDLCSCTIPGTDHPTEDDFTASCQLTLAPEAIFAFDKGSYQSISASSCDNAGLPTSTTAGYYDVGTTITLFDGNPYGTGRELVCNGDAVNEGNGCSKLWDPETQGAPADLTNIPSASSKVYFVVEGSAFAGWWDGTTDRVFTFELSPNPATVCGDGTQEQNELCDDGNLIDGDGCSSNCEPEPLHIQDCDAAYCTLAAGAGPNGGDLCTCTLDGARHPQIDLLTPVCGFAAYYTPEVLFSFDKASYESISASTCDSTLTTTGGIFGYDQSSIMSLYTDDPRSGGQVLACNDDAVGEGNGCSKVWDPQTAATPASLVNIPPDGSRVWFAVDDSVTGGFWNGTDDRIVTFELSTTPASVCGDGTQELTEECDDGNNVDGDGCDSTCGREPMVLNDCDPTYCTMTAGGGPSGGDLCVCTIQGPDHPGDALDVGSCFQGDTGNEVVIRMDTTNYTSFRFDACTGGFLGALADGSAVAFDGDPRTGGAELVCTEDATLFALCPVLATGNGQQGVPTPVPASNDLWLVLDEYYVGDFWDGLTDRTFHIELIP